MRSLAGSQCWIFHCLGLSIINQMVTTYGCIDPRAEMSATAERDSKGFNLTPWLCWLLIRYSNLSRLKSPFSHTQHLLYPPKIIMIWNNLKSESIDLLENPFWRLINPKFEEIPNCLLAPYCTFSSYWVITQLKALSQG